VNAAACTLLALALWTVPTPSAVRWRARWPAARTASPRWSRRQLGVVAPAALGGLVGLLVAGPAGGFAAAGAAQVVRGRRRWQRREALAAQAAGQLADALRRITDELRAGSHPAAALAGTTADGPLAHEVLAGAAAAARLGEGVPAALRRGVRDRPELAADLERVATAWSLAEQHGVPLADLLARAQSDIRWRARFGDTVRAQLAGPRATAAVLTGLPLLGLGLGQLVGAEPLAVLRDGLLGQALLVVGTGLALAGTAWADRILRAAVPR
jgi:tight adherence protein B